LSGVLRTQIRKLLLISFAWLAVGTYFVLRPSRGDNLYLVVGLGCYILSAAGVVLASSWALRAHRAASGPVQVRPLPGAGNTGAGRLTVHRPLATASDPVRRYRIQLDGSTIGALRFGEYFSLSIAPGRHSIRAVFDRWGSPTLHFDVDEGQEFTFAADASAGSPQARRAGDAITLRQLSS
jgi:hypothetical protein